MATIVIHGTMTILPSKFSHWWWDSWYERGFLDSVRKGMLAVAGRHDLWTVGGQPVSQIEALRMKWSFWKGYKGQAPTHQGHFIWGGADDYISRKAGAFHLVLYLNKLVELAPEEPLSVIAHSHGCNILKMASSNADLIPSIRFRRAVFLACPHFEARSLEGPIYSYRANPSRFGKILNLSSEGDTVQVGFADTIPGMPGPNLHDWYPPKAYRTDRDPRAAPLYDSWNLSTQDQGKDAHTVMHGAAVGGLVGCWIASNMSFKEVLDGIGNQLLPVPRGDFGEK
jgi:hypothetical protein